MQNDVICVALGWHSMVMVVVEESVRVLLGWLTFTSSRRSFLILGTQSTFNGHWRMLF